MYAQIKTDAISIITTKISILATRVFRLEILSNPSVWLKKVSLIASTFTIKLLLVTTNETKVVLFSNIF